MNKPTLYLIGGATASGKTALAIKIAAQVSSPLIINADSMQIYRGLPLLTAQPSAAERAAAPHILYEILEPHEKFSVGKWLTLVHKTLQNALENGHTPILVGGTGLYFKALTEGLSAIPEVAPEVRDAAAKLYEAEGSDGFRAKLAELDSISAERIMPNDRQRLIRAYEVAVGTGQPLSYWHKIANDTLDLSLIHVFHVKHIILMPDRATLYERCDRRFEIMVNEGALDEVRDLMALHLDPSLPAMKILGVRELGAMLDGSMSRDEAIAKAKQMTRNYAKRQSTWFRNQWLKRETVEVFVSEDGTVPIRLSVDWSGD